MSQGLVNVLLLVPTFLFSLCVHEFAHAWTAVKRGDPTPQLLGRLSLHPMAHADLFGTLLLPTLCIYYGLPFVGWAQPVPIDVRNLRRGRRDMALVAIAGPASNILLALLATVWLAILVHTPFLNAHVPDNVMETLQLFGVVSIQVNLALALFNLIPIPPLDGFNIVQAFLPRRVLLQLTRYGRYAGLALMLVLFTGGFQLLRVPLSMCFNFLVHLVA